jgi:hypothetical protein
MLAGLPTLIQTGTDPIDTCRRPRNKALRRTTILGDLFVEQEARLPGNTREGVTGKPEQNPLDSFSYA